MKLNTKTLIVIADLVLFIALLYFSPFGETKVNQGLSLLVFIAILWLSEALHVTITAILVPVLAAILGLLPTPKALSGFADSNIFLFFGGFALAAAMHHQKLDKMIAHKILSLAKGHLGLSSLYIFITTAFLSMWMSNTATAAMMLPLAIGMLATLDPEKDRNTYVFVLLGIAFSASIGGIGTIIGTPPNAIAATQLNITFAQWLQYGIPIVLVFLPAMIFILYFVFKPKFNAQIDLHTDYVELTRPRVTTLIIFLAVALAWIFSGKISPFIEATFGYKIANLDAIIALLAAILVCVFKVIDWKSIQKNTDWGVLLLFGGGITLSVVLRDSGASKVMADTIISFIENGHLFIIGLVVAFFIVFLTEFTSNTASAALLVPLFISIAETLGVPALGLALIIAIGASCAFMLPVATPPNAIVFGTGHIKQQEMVKVGIILNVFCSISIAIIAYFFWL
ncbi:DASS family sodium-coupled anion symporter [Campylobacter volucris]|uniref:DASS family sodium-coupled anion symporter n=1 Tax=Campylobacter volucris TaxID=1031542 RepID=A0AAE5YH67_9BACT|nr:DASS family sodium-coupled anion symporter [Campylobacter volucris]AJC94423.1 DASS family sodium/dicarboxylate symporter [Campylobacter volucris LMG 24379]KAB0579014.1 DASS family sodium-coupled anion symporter [Campylobacter volucris]QBL13221.1 DASS family sodium-coupled anion symporter [Campylobacter volucris]QEL08640.1 sodium:dicarboxylate cotransporter (permease SLC13 domain) [Campylobacter volucris]TDJ81219.1 DASS family sodium-coupled anion symporter [Campylobacter volucris]